MRKWAVLTVGFYALALMALTTPLLVVFVTNLVIRESEWSSMATVADTLQVYRAWGYWLWLGLLLLGQALLLLVPLDLARRRPPSRRRLAAPVVVAALLMANLTLAGAFSLLCLGWGDEAFKVIEFLMRVVSQETRLNPLVDPARQQMGLQSESYEALAVLVGLLLAGWGFWGLVFARFARAQSPQGLMDRLTRWLLRGSILELLIAVPSHVVARHRNDCCAPAATFWGIVTGLSIMLLAFGPAVFFLFVARFQRLRPRSEEPAEPRP
jgi:hypothetical protein